MHELALACDVLDAAERAMGPGKRLLRVDLALGPLSGVSAEALTFCFSELAEQRGLGRAELVLCARPARIRCRACGHSYETDDFMKGCPRCDSLSREILSGFECELESVTFEESASDECAIQS